MIRNHRPTQQRRRLLTATAGLTALVALAGCAATEAGTASSDPQEVARYAAAVSSSRAATLAATVASVCRDWESSYETRQAKTTATTNYTKDPKWDWPGIAPLVAAELSAISTESGKLPALISKASVKPALQTGLTTYKDRLDAYGVALKADTDAKGDGDNTWPKRNPAVRTLRSAIDSVQATCKE